MVYNHLDVPFQGSFEVPSDVHKILMNEFYMLSTTVRRELGPMHRMAQSSQYEVSQLKMAELQSRRGITGSAGDVIVAGSLRGLPVDVWVGLFEKYGISNPPDDDRAETAQLIEMLSDIWQKCFEGKDDGKTGATKGHEMKYRSHYKSILMRSLSRVTVRTGTARSKDNGIEWRYDTMAVNLFFTTAFTSGETKGIIDYAARGSLFCGGNEVQMLSSIANTLERADVEEMRICVVPVNRGQDLYDRPLVNGFNAIGVAGAVVLKGKKGGHTSRNSKAAKHTSYSSPSGGGGGGSGL
jgi:hypothetical protein